jgi:hypothetical protein
MKKLIAIGVLGLALGLSSLSFATDYMGLYTKSMVRSEVKNKIKSGDVEKDFISFYTSPKTLNTTTSLEADQESDDDDTYIVFGVQVPRGPRS